MECLRSGNAARMPVADRNQNNALSPAAVLQLPAIDAATAFNPKEAVSSTRTFRADIFPGKSCPGGLSGTLSRAHITATFPGLPKQSNPIDILYPVASVWRAEGSDARVSQHVGGMG